MNPKKMMEMMHTFFNGKECGCDPEKMFELMSSFCCEPSKAQEKVASDETEDAGRASCG